MLLLAGQTDVARSLYKGNTFSEIEENWEEKKCSYGF
jgi:hypothetical protein